MKIPEKSVAGGAESAAGPVSRFADDLRELYEAAGGGTSLTYQRLIRLAEQHHRKVSTSGLSDWLRGKTVPRKPEHVYYVLRVLIPFLEGHAQQRDPARRPTAPGAWQARLDSAQAVSKSGQGGRGPRVHAASPGRLVGGPSHALQDVFPYEFVGRDEELAELEAFATAPDGAPPYLWWQAGPWAGKTALLAWFASRRLPAGVDVAHYFIVGRLGTDRREGFVRVVGQQLASAAGSRRPPAVDNERPDLSPLYEAAARACAKRHRRLLLIVDGLDEDADSRPGGSGHRRTPAQAPAARHARHRHRAAQPARSPATRLRPPAPEPRHRPTADRLARSPGQAGHGPARAEHPAGRPGRRPTPAGAARLGRRRPHRSGPGRARRHHAVRGAAEAPQRGRPVHGPHPCRPPPAGRAGGG